MKSFLGFLVFLCIALPMAAEKKPQQAVYTEFGGISNTFSVSYDARFHGNKGLGYSVGLSYGGEDSPFAILNDDSYMCDGVAVPLEINTLSGGRRNFLDLGIGLSLGYYQHRTTNSWALMQMNNDGSSVTEKGMRNLISDPLQKEGSFGYYSSLRVSYRYQAPRGLFFRVGVAFLSGFKDLKYSVSQHTAVAPHISFGLSF